MLKLDSNHRGSVNFITNSFRSILLERNLAALNKHNRLSNLDRNMLVDTCQHADDLSSLFVYLD